MRTTLIIAGTEARRIFVSPLAWAVLAVMQIIVGFMFLYLLLDYANHPAESDDYVGMSDYIGGGLYGIAVFVLLLIMPLLTMRTFSEERRSGSLTLLLSSPATLIEVVLGKFLGLSVFMGAALLLMAMMPLTLLVGTNLDVGRIAAGLLGLTLVMSAFGASGLFVSTLTREPVIAAVVSFGLLLVVWLFGILGTRPGLVGEIFGYLALIGHFENLRRGIFNSADVVYYLLFTTLFLWLAVVRLDSERA